MGSVNNMAEEKVALVLQGGGALGAYQAGAYQALAEQGYLPERIAGISIGSINAAIIAGNRPEDRVAKLRLFWDKVSAHLKGQPWLMKRWLFNETSAALGASFGIPGFFTPRYASPEMMLDVSPCSLGMYDTSPLRDTLFSLVDFDLLNRSDIAFAVGAVHVTSGNFVYFDKKTHTIGPEHIMASGALPPGFPPVNIDGEWYWDGGLVSNTPLQYLLDSTHDGEDWLVFQVDLFNAKGPMPKAFTDIDHRVKDIRYSSRTRLNTNTADKLFQLHQAAKRLAKKLPKELADDPDLARLLALDEPSMTIMHLIHRRSAYHTQSKDYEFSRMSINEHWQDGFNDVTCSVESHAWQNRTQPESGVAVFDLTKHNQCD